MSMRRALWVCSGLLLLVGCGARAAPAGPPPPRLARPAQPIERLVPLPHDHVYVYELVPEGGGEPGVLILGVQRRGSRAELGSGDHRQRLELSAEGVEYVAGGWLLKLPLEPGARWRGAFGEVRVTAVEQTVSVPAGEFQHCVQTTESATTPSASRRVTTTFCPDVGIVELYSEQQVGAEYHAERARLRSFAPKVDLTLGSAPQ